MANNNLGAFKMSDIDEYQSKILSPIHPNSTALPTIFADKIFKAAAWRCQTILVAHKFEANDEFAEFFTVNNWQMNVWQLEELMYGVWRTVQKLQVAYQ